MQIKNCKLLRIYISEDSKYKSHNLSHAFIMKLKEEGISGATLIRGIEGYGESKTLHSTKIFELSTGLPLIIEIIDIKENIEKALKISEEMIQDGIVTLSDIEVFKFGRDTK